MARIVVSMAVMALSAGLLLPTAASAPAAIANRANGLDYQPTPGDVTTREKAAGLPQPPAPSARQLEAIDRTLLRQEGASTQNVPALASHP